MQAQNKLEVTMSEDDVKEIVAAELNRRFKDMLVGSILPSDVRITCNSARTGYMCQPDERSEAHIKEVRVVTTLSSKDM